MHVTDTDNYVYKLLINKKNYVYKYQTSQNQSQTSYK